MAEILEDKNVLHLQSPSRSDKDYLSSAPITQDLPDAIRASGASGLQPRDLVFSILSEDGKRIAMERLSSKEGNRFERNIGHGQSPSPASASPRDNLVQIYNTAT